MDKPTELDLTTSQIVPGNAFDLLAGIPDNSVDLVISSPPYNIGKAYERGMFTNVSRISKVDGRIC